MTVKEILDNSKWAVFDIETNGLLLDVDKFWVGYVLNGNEKTYKKFLCPFELVNYLNEFDYVVHHNGIAYDIPVLEKLTGLTLTSRSIDTLIYAKLAYYDKDKRWSHSLDAYGERLKFKKGSHNDWSKYSDEMDVYCKQDVAVTIKLLEHLTTCSWLSYETLDVEQQVQKIMTKQYLNGWTLDVSKAQALHVELMEEYEKCLVELQEVFKPMFLPDGKESTPKKEYRRLGIHYVGPAQKITLTEFNPGSGNHIVWWVEHLYGKQQWLMTDKGNPKTDSDTLNDMFKDMDWSEPLLHYLEVQKILGQLAEGPKAWLKQVRKGRLHHSVDILGTNTGRATHNKPNLAQVPSPRAYKGKEARQLFVPSKGMVSVGCDLSGVELRCLAHYMSMYDGGEYGKVILEGDIHTVNQLAAGLPTRDNAKTFIYGFLYGAGDAKIGTIVKGTKKEGKKLKNSFLKKLPALKKLTDLVKEKAKRGFLVGWSGRRLHIRSPHSALNVLLQSLGGYISKVWMIEAHKMIEENNIICNQLGWIHDELQFEVIPEHKDLLKQVLEESAVKAGEVMGLKMRIDAEAKDGLCWYDVH